MRRYRCPYCRFEFTDPPQSGKCTQCGKHMRLPPGVGKKTDMRARKKKIETLYREADSRRKALHSAPEFRPGRNPRVLFAIAVIFLIISVLFVKRDQEAGKRPAKSPLTKVLSDLYVLSQATGRFEFHVGRYPTEQEGLYVLIDGRHIRGWRGPYLRGIMRPDSWRTPYAYATSSNGIPLIYSAGPDRQTNTVDDIFADPQDLDPGTSWTNNWYRPRYRFNPAP